MCIRDRDQPVVSENREVYRGEYLAYLMLNQINAGQIELPKSEDPTESDDAKLLEAVQNFMAPRYSEGYVKGVHDHDAAKILKPLLALDHSLGLLKYSTQARTLAGVFWLTKADTDWRTEWENQFSVLQSARTVFGNITDCLLYTSPSPRDATLSRMPSSA